MSNGTAIFKLTNFFCPTRRFSDFQVNEIDMSGQVLHLTTGKAELLSVPVKEVEKKSEVESGADASTSSDPVVVEKKSPEVAFEELMLSESGSAEGLDKLLSLANRVKSSQSDESDEGKASLKQLLKEEVLLVTGERSKAWRGSFHQLVREHFPFLRSESISKPDAVPTMRIWYGVDKYDKQRAREAQPGKYLKFVMQKENKDTSEAIQLISRMFGFRNAQIKFAGMKDKRGVTSQAVTIPFVDVKRAAGMNSRLIGLTKIGNFSAVNEPLALGMLSGNKFKVILRDLKLMPSAPFPGKSKSKSEKNSNASNGSSSSDNGVNSIDSDLPENKMIVDNGENANDDVEETVTAIIQACEKFSSLGFINYYGTQRFGTGAVRTHEIGVKCLKGNWKEVVSLIMAPRTKERADAAQARRLFAEGKYSEALRCIPKFMANERSVLQGLVEGGANNFKGAFERLPRHMRLMYVHAYQSYIFNMAASKRIELFGYKVAVGDLVVTDLSALKQRSIDDDDGAENENIDASESDNVDMKAKKPAYDAVKIIKSEEEAKQYAMTNVVLPLPGIDVLLPQNEIGQYIRDLLEKDGMTMAFENDKTFFISGDYRPIIVKPIDFEFHVLRYENPDAELQTNEHPEYVLENGGTEKKLDIVPDGKRVALQLIFSLPSSSYASCLVRELVKQPFDQAFLRDVHGPSSSKPAAPQAAPSSENTV